MSYVDNELAGLLRTIDLAILGTRLRNARLAKGLTQAEVAGSDASTAYISRIEAGHRRPDGRLLERIAGRLDTTLDELLHGVDPHQKAEATLKLDYAELALTAGNADEALTRTAEVLELTGNGVLPELGARASYLRALAFEAAGRVEDAILALEDLPVDIDGTTQLTAAIALSRCYRESGDLARAIDTGERALKRLEEYQLEGSNEAVQLAVTMAAAHFERGDVAYAVRLCRRAIERAEKLDSPQAKASAYWNASIMEANQGAVDAAVPLAQKALALLELGNDTRNLARLRSQLGVSQLRLDPPAIEDARANLEQARRELEWSSASPADSARNEIALARAGYLAGDLKDATQRATQIFETFRGTLPMVAADALILSGQVAADQGDTARAQAAYREAILTLTGIGSDRNAAQLWFELGGLLEEVGASDEARDAYRRAAASTGLTPRPASTHALTGPDPASGGGRAHAPAPAPFLRRQQHQWSPGPAVVIPAPPTAAPPSSDATVVTTTAASLSLRTMANSLRRALTLSAS
jgi:tetratricopeptide (TPR) repeat protein